MTHLFSCSNFPRHIDCILMLVQDHVLLSRKYDLYIRLKSCAMSWKYFVSLCGEDPYVSIYLYVSYACIEDMFRIIPLCNFFNYESCISYRMNTY